MDLNKSTVDFTRLYKFARKYPVLGRSTFSLHYFKNSVWFIKDFCKRNKSSFQMSRLVMMLWIIIAFSFFPQQEFFFLLWAFFFWLWGFFSCCKNSSPIKRIFLLMRIFWKGDWLFTNKPCKTHYCKIWSLFYCWKENLFRLKNISKDGIKNV